MTKEQALYQSLAACGAALITFIGICHEVVGAELFPWGPAFLDGPIGWNAVGLFAIAAGVALLGGTLHLYRFPVVAFSILAALIGAFFLIVTAVLHHQFHLFALVGSISGVVTAYFHHSAA